MSCEGVCNWECLGTHFPSKCDACKKQAYRAMSPSICGGCGHRSDCNFEPSEEAIKKISKSRTSYEY